MGRIIKAELYKILHVPSFILSVLFAIPAGVLWAFLIGAKGGVAMSDLVSNILLVCPYFFITIVIIYVTNDYEKGTIKAIVSSGVSKTKIYFGRMVVSVLIAEATYLLCILGMFIGGTVKGVPMTSPAFPWTSSQFLSSILIQMFIVILYASLGYFVGIAVRKQTFSIILGTMIIALEPLIIQYLGKFLNVKLDMLDMSELAMRLEELQISWDAILGMAILTVIIVLITFVIGVQMFKRRDV